MHFRGPQCVLFTFLGRRHQLKLNLPLPPLPLYFVPTTWGRGQRGVGYITRPCPTSSSSHSSSTSSSGAPLPAPCMPLTCTGRAWLLVRKQGLRWSSGQRESISPYPAGLPLPQQQPHQPQQVEEGGLAGSRTENEPRNSVQGGKAGAASQQPGYNNRPKGQAQPTTRSRRQPAAAPLSVQSQLPQTVHSSYSKNNMLSPMLPSQQQGHRQ